MDKGERIKRIIKRENSSIEEAKHNLETKDNIKIRCGLDIIVSRCNAIINADKSLDNNIKNVLNLIENYNK